MRVDQIEAYVEYLKKSFFKEGPVYDPTVMTIIDDWKLMHECLTYYAEEDNWVGAPDDSDLGETARDCLAKVEGKDG